MSEELIHSDLGASSSERWFNCPGSINLTKDIPEPPSSVYADEGNCAHEVVAECLKNDTHAWFHVGERYFNHEVTEEMAEHCQTYIDYIEKRVKESKSHFHVEQKLPIGNTKGKLWGTSDCVLCEYFGVLEVIDFKYGRGVVVEVQDNSQGLYYGVGAFEKYNKEYEFTSIKITIVQPRVFHVDGPIRSMEVSVDDLKKFKKKLLAHVEETEKPDAPLHAGDWCRWCKGAFKCPELKEDIHEVTDISFDAIDETVDQEKIFKLDPIDVARSLSAIPRIKGWIQAVEMAGLHLAKQEIPVPGFKVVRSRKNRAFKDKAMVEQYLKDVKVSPKLFYKSVLKTPKQILEAIPKKHAKAVDLMIHTPEGDLKLVPEFDVRQEVIDLTPQVDFQPLEEDPIESLTSECFMGKDEDLKDFFDEEVQTDEPKPKRQRKHTANKGKATPTKRVSKTSGRTKKGKPNTKKTNSKPRNGKRTVPKTQSKLTRTKGKPIKRISNRSKKVKKILRRK